MREQQQSTITSGNAFSFREASRQFRIHLEAAGKARETVGSYMEAVRQAATFLRALGLPDDIEAVSAEHLREFFADLGRRTSSATVVNRFKGVRAFFAWLHDEGEISGNPMRRLQWPRLEEKPVRAVTPADVRAMLGTCGRDFLGRRDTALIGCMVDLGWRTSEILALTVERMVEGPDHLTVPAKGKKYVTGRLSPVVLEMVNRYLRVRQSHLPQLWLSRLGSPMERHGVRDVLAYRSKRAGIGHVHPHMLRHTHAIWWLEAGGNLMDLKENLGHSSIRITERYLQYMARERAMEARRQFAPGNRLVE